MTNYNIHPVLQDMVNLGCRNQFGVGVAFQVFMDLCEVQATRDVNYLYNPELDLLYLTALTKYSTDASLPEIFVPLSTVSNITSAWIQKVQNTLCTKSNVKRITLAMKEHDSTIVYYCMTQGLVPPDSPETTCKKKLHEEKKQAIETEILKMRCELFNKAYEVKKLPSEKEEIETVLSNELENGDSDTLLKNNLVLETTSIEKSGNEGKKITEKVSHSEAEEKKFENTSVSGAMEDKIQNLTVNESNTSADQTIIEVQSSKSDEIMEVINPSNKSSGKKGIEQRNTSKSPRSSSVGANKRQRFNLRPRYQSISPK